MDDVAINREGNTADRSWGLSEQVDQDLLLFGRGIVVPGLFTDKVAEAADNVLEIIERFVLILGLIPGAPFFELLPIGVVHLALAFEDLTDVVYEKMLEMFRVCFVGSFRK